jgi:hypothetical protein
MHVSIYEKKKKKKSTFTVFSVVISPFNGYIARFLGGFPQQFVTNFTGFAIQKGGPRSGSGTLIYETGFRWSKLEHIGKERMKIF